MSMPMRLAASSTFCVGDDFDPERREGLAGDRSHRHEERLWEARSSRARGFETRSVRRQFIYFQRTSRRPDKNHLARWARGVLIHQAIGRGPLYLALCCRWRGDDQHRPNGLSHRRDRLANATKNLASTNGWIS